MKRHICAMTTVAAWTLLACGSDEHTDGADCWVKQVATTFC